METTTDKTILKFKYDQKIQDNHEELRSLCSLLNGFTTGISVVNYQKIKRRGKIVKEGLVIKTENPYSKKSSLKSSLVYMDYTFNDDDPNEVELTSSRGDVFTIHLLENQIIII